MKIAATRIPDVLLIEPAVHGDARGFFMETFRQSWFDELGLAVDFVQDNHSRSSQGILRGLHYQVNKPQGKLVRAVAGAIFDVAVDLRRSLPTFGQWVGEILSEQNRRQLWVPAGFAHGFYVISDVAEVVYKCTEYYSPADDRSLLWNDESIGIDWPLLDPQPTLSEKDRQAPGLDQAELFQ